MDDAAADTEVEWREWGRAAFDEAAERDCPVLLALTTPWCVECREMDATTYSDPPIAANCNDDFVPVRVDADRNPRVRDRYGMGGFPSTVFCTPDGTVLTGATFLGVDGFRGILDSVRETWEGAGEAAGSVPRTLRDAIPPGGAVTARAEEHMVEQLLATYDEEYGGWGGDVKFPLPRTIEFALVRARDQALRTLEAVRAHLYDTYDGGFYRFAAARNWADARREKLVDENAALLRAFAHAYRYTGDEAFLEPAEGTLEWLTSTAWTGSAFGASQGGDDDYFRLPPAERESATAPAVDETVFADRNGLAVDACCWLAAYTDDERARRYARRARDHVRETLVDDEGAVTHYVDRSGDDGVERGEVGLLLDQARVLQGLASSWQVLGEAGSARAVADWTLEHRRGAASDGGQSDTEVPPGAVVDGPLEGPGLCDRALYPLDGAVELADALVNLAALSGEERYATAAREAVAAFGDAAERMGVEVAGYATVTARLRSPTVVEVGTPAGSDLHRAALRLADHESVVVPDAHEYADERSATLADQPGPDPGRARRIVDGDVRGTAESPAALEELITRGTDV